MGRSWLLIMGVATSATYMSVAMDFLRLALVQSTSGPVCSGGSLSELLS